MAATLETAFVRLDETPPYKSRKQVSEAVLGKQRKTIESHLGLPAAIFTTCLSLLTALQPLQRQWTPVQKARFVDSHGNLCLWRDNILESRLELCLAYSTDLRQSILDLLCNIGKTTVQGTIIHNILIAADQPSPWCRDASRIPRS